MPRTRQQLCALGIPFDLPAYENAKFSPRSWQRWQLVATFLPVTDLGTFLLRRRAEALHGLVEVSLLLWCKLAHPLLACTRFE